MAIIGPLNRDLIAVCAVILAGAALFATGFAWGLLFNLQGLAHLFKRKGR